MNYTCLKETVKILRFGFSTNSVDDLESLPSALSSFLRSNLPIQFIYTIFRKVTQSQTPVCPSALWAFPQPEASGCFTLTNKRCLEPNSSPSNWVSFPTAVFPPVIPPSFSSSARTGTLQGHIWFLSFLHTPSPTLASSSFTGPRIFFLLLSPPLWFSPFSCYS